MSRAAALLLLIAFGATACANTFDATKLGVPVTMAAPPGEIPPGNRFRVTSRAIYGFWGLIPIQSPSLQRSLAAQLAGGTGVADLRIKVRSRWSDLLITGLTLGLVAPRSVTFEGVVLEK